MSEPHGVVYVCMVCAKGFFVRLSFSTLPKSRGRLLSGNKGLLLSLCLEEESEPHDDISLLESIIGAGFL